MHGTTECDFIFVPDGVPFPWDWVRDHPHYMILPARFEGVTFDPPGSPEMTADATAPDLPPDPRPVAMATPSAPPGVAAPIGFYQKPDVLPSPKGHWAAPKTPDDPEAAVARPIELGSVVPDLVKGEIADWLALVDLGARQL